MQPLIQTFSSPSPSPFFLPLPSRSSLRLFSSFPGHQPQPTSFPSFPFSPPSHNFHFPQSPQRQPTTSDSDTDDEVIIGDCLVFEEGAFDQPIDPFISKKTNNSNKRKKRRGGEPESHDLVPDKWRQMVEEINLTKKEKRKIANELRFGNKMERRKPRVVPVMDQYKVYKEMKPSERNFPEVVVGRPEVVKEVMELLPPEGQSRVLPKNPRLEVYGGSLDDINEFFNSSDYLSEEKNEDKKSEVRTKLFTQEEKTLLNRKNPDLKTATTSKWMPFHSLAASGEFYLLDKLMRHISDINAVDKDGLAAIHRAILGKKIAVVNYLLRNSANPFILDNDGATLMHYSVQTASSDIIKILLLYNIDINLADNDGWTPLHLAVQSQRTDIVKLLLIKGADRSLKNNDGLTPLELCLYLGQNVRTYELIKLFKEFRVSKLKIRT